MILKSQFKPAFGLSNGHIQTLLPTLLRIKARPQYHQQTLELDDGDFLDLNWTELPTDNKPIIIIFHGLQGSINSPYAGIMLALKQCGWSAVLMHFRGCSGRPNRLPRSYHSGETGDAKIFLRWLQDTYPNSNLAAIGYSLGGNMLLKLQAELGEDTPLKAAVSVCAPLMLDNCANRLNRGVSRVYQTLLIRSLKKNITSKAKRFDLKKLINLDQQNIRQLNSFWKFDDKVTAPLHGFKNAEDYYSKCSARQYLKAIKSPTLIIQTLDDPFMSADVIPDETELSTHTQLEISRYGGHVGFIHGRLFKPEFWLEKRIPAFLSDKLS